MSYAIPKLTVCCLILCLLGGSLPAARAQQGSFVRVDEKSLRKIAVNSVMPSYPEDSKRQGVSGAAVAEVTINGKGGVTRVEVVEAPDQLIRQAVADAVGRWKFKSTTSEDRPVNLKGKLTFYFVIDERGEARVENPRQFR